MNTVDGLTQRHDFEPKIDRQSMKCDSVHCHATKTNLLDHDIRGEYDGWFNTETRFRAKNWQTINEV